MKSFVNSYHKSKGYTRHNFNSNYKPRKHYNNRSHRYFKRSNISVDRLVHKVSDTKAVEIYVKDYQCSQFEVSNILKKNIQNKGYTNPTKIQYAAIPKILAGKDVLGTACTGSGKTAAFLIPMINKILSVPSSKCLIIVPTRELAIQILDEARDLSKNTNIKSTLIIGGSNMKRQIDRLRHNPELIIATPGRLKDLVQRNKINLATINNIVLDEVDRMLDMGFIKDIKFIIERLNTKRQSLFFAATMNTKTEALANTFLNTPVKIETETPGPNTCVDQDVVKIGRNDKKVEVLLKILKNKEVKKVLIFTETKRGADRLCKELKYNKLFVDSLHGNKRQGQRTRIINSFRNGTIDVLVATDIASRGIDILNISHIINYSMPHTYDDYIHRIGRTGRAGKTGHALTFIKA